MALRIGDKAPDFTAETQKGEVNLYTYLGDSWGILCSHPADFTPVCTTELGDLAKRREAWERRNTKVLALSVDPPDSHTSWIKDIEETQHTSVYYPIIADKDRKIATLYGMLDASRDQVDGAGLPLTVRAVFIIDPAKVIKWIIIYPASCGRNFDEVERCLDSLQLSSKHRVTTPANWRPGSDVIVAPAVKDDEAAKIFGEFTTLKPYLRLTKQPQ